MLIRYQEKKRVHVGVPDTQLSNRTPELDRSSSSSANRELPFHGLDSRRSIRLCLAKAGSWRCVGLFSSFPALLHLSPSLTGHPLEVLSVTDISNHCTSQCPVYRPEEGATTVASRRRRWAGRLHTAPSSPRRKAATCRHRRLGSDSLHGPALTFQSAMKSSPSVRDALAAESNASVPAKSATSSWKKAPR